MKYSDDDVSASEEEPDAQPIGDEPSDDPENELSDAEEDDLAVEKPAAATGTAATVSARGLNGDTALVAQDALLNGAPSTTAALLQLQVSELLSEVAICHGHSRLAAVEGLVQQLATALANMPARVLTGQADQGLAELISSWGVNPQDMSCAVSPPAAVQLVGSWPIRAAARLPAASTAAAAAAAAVVDVAVQIPNSCLHHKDILNYRYHAKRVLYLSAVSAHLAAHSSIPLRSVQQQLAALHGDPCRPVLLLHVNPETLAALLPKPAAAAAAGGVFAKGGVVLRLLPVVGLDAFEISKLAPDRNNVRWAVGSSDQQSAGNQQQQQQQEQQPTPHYNTGILHDMLLLLNQHRLQQVAAAAGPKFADALLLVKVWAHKCGLSVYSSLPSSSSSSSSAALAAATAAQADGFSGHLLAQLLAAAVQQVGLSAAAAMSPLQQLRCVLQLLTNKQYWGAKGAGGIALQRDSSVPVELRVQHQQQQQQQQQHTQAAAPVAGKVSKDHAKLQQKSQQQLQQLPAPAATPTTFKRAYDIVILDSTGHLNLAAAVSKSSFQLAQMAAQQTLAVMDRQALEPDVVYNVMFGPSQGLAGVFDYWWTVEVPDSSSSSSGGVALPGDLHAARVAESQVERLVRQALTSRALLVKAIRTTPTYKPAAPQQQQQQDAEQPPKKRKKADGTAKPVAGSSSSSSGVFGVVTGAAQLSRRITVGVVAAAAAALRVVDVGPAADDTAAAAKFRALWGGKAELRRFQDGKISEAVVWEGVPPGERHRIPDMAVQHVLLRLLPGGAVVQSCSTALDPLLYPASTAEVLKSSSTSSGVDVNLTGVQPSSSSTSSTAVQIGSGSTSRSAAAETAASRAADAALDSLGKQLRGLSDLALKVIGVQPISAVSRHTCCFYPEPHPLAEGSGEGVYAPGVKVPRVLEPIEVMVQLEGSGRMPADPVAFAKTKAALGVQLASALTSACGAAVTATEESLEVLWQGYAFKLLLFMDRDNPMLAAAAAADGNSPAASRMPLPLLLARHHGLISSLEAAHAAYGPTVRLAKRWLGLQLLLGPHQLAEEAVELLVGAVFQGPAATQPPASRISGFLAFLQLLVSHPWSAAPLLVDPAAEVKQDHRRKLQVEFEGRRAAGTLPGMFIATPYDLHSSRWTAHHPSPSVTHHLVSLAQTAVQQLSRLLLLGPDAPAAQQQLQQIRLLEQRKPRKRAVAAATGAEAAPGEQQQNQGLQQEMAALAKAWRAASGSNLSGFDVWIILRKEALPYGNRSDPLATQQLELLLKQQRSWRLQLLGAAAGDSSKARKKHHKTQQEDDNYDGHDGSSAGGGNLLADVLSSTGCQVDAPKSSRAVLRSIPEQVLLSKPVEKLRAELLVGFDPVNHYVMQCMERYGHLAAFCADSAGGFAAVGVKWKPEAFLPAPLRPAVAHGVMEIDITSRVAAAAAAIGKGGKKGKSRGLAGLVVPNVAQVLSELGHLGLGLVQEVVVMQ